MKGIPLVLILSTKVCLTICEIDKLNKIMRQLVQILPKGFELNVQSENVKADTWAESESKKPGS